MLAQASFDEATSLYGNPRVHDDLLEQDEHVSRRRVVRLPLRMAWWRGPQTLRHDSDPDQPVAANLLDRRFEAEAPNQRWVGDTTESVIGGKLYLAVILDPFSALRRRRGDQRRE